MVQDHGITIPDNIRGASTLTQFAVWTRYPRSDDWISPDEHRAALQLAEKVVQWAEALIASLS